MCAYKKQLNQQRCWKCLVYVYNVAHHSEKKFWTQIW